jgi:hypothetical protein
MKNIARTARRSGGKRIEDADAVIGSSFLVDQAAALHTCEPVTLRPVNVDGNIY